MKKCKRDIYKSRFDMTFDFDKDIDLADLRQLLALRIMDDEERERFGHYVDNIASIILKSNKFCGFPESVKQDIRSLGVMDALIGYRGFNGGLYTAATAPFSYIYRIIYNRATNVCKAYYKQRCVAFSQLPDTFERNVADMKAQDDEADKQTDNICCESIVPPPINIIKSRIRASVKAVLKRRIQMELNLA